MKKGKKNMKIIFLRKNEKKALTQILYELVRQPGCSYELTTILEKLDYSKYEKAFDLMKNCSGTLRSTGGLDETSEGFF